MKILITSDWYIPAVNGVVTSVLNLKRGLEARGHEVRILTDIVHSNCEFSTFPLAQRISFELHIPLIHTYHTVYENYTHYFSPSKVWGRKLVTVFSRKVAVRVRKQLGISPEQVVLISVGRMAKEKNGEELIRIMTHFREENIRLLLVGDGPCRQELQKQAEELGVEH